MKKAILFAMASMSIATTSAYACGNLSQLIATTSQIVGQQVDADFNIGAPKLIATIFLYSPKSDAPACSENVTYMNVRRLIESKGWAVTPRNIFRAEQILNN